MYARRPTAQLVIRIDPGRVAVDVADEDPLVAGASDGGAERIGGDDAPGFATAEVLDLLVGHLASQAAECAQWNEVLLVETER